MKNLYYYNIVVRESRHGKVLAHLFWKGFKLEQHVKWKWYFKYREALLRIKHPRAFFDISWGGYEPTEKKSQQRLLKDQITSKKRNLTKWKNKMKNYKAEVLKANKTRLIKIKFSDDVNYEKAIAKIDKLENELNELLRQEN